MQARLELIRKSAVGPQYFLRALQTFGGALEMIPQTTINALSYRQDALEMTVNAPSLASISQFSQLVGKGGLTAEIKSSNPVANGVEAHLQVHDQNQRAHR
jgi:hypothetical protein